MTLGCILTHGSLVSMLFYVFYTLYLLFDPLPLAWHMPLLQTLVGAMIGDSAPCRAILLQFKLVPISPAEYDSAGAEMTRAGAEVARTSAEVSGPRPFRPRPHRGLGPRSGLGLP